MASPTSRPRTPGKSSPPESHPTLDIENGNGSNPQVSTRRTSLGFLRRSKSTEPLADRRPSGGRVSKKMLKEQARDEEFRRQREAAIPKLAPRLPDLSPTPQLKTFGGDDRPDSVAIISNRLGNRPTSPLPVAVPVQDSDRDSPRRRNRRTLSGNGWLRYSSSV